MYLKFLWLAIFLFFNFNYFLLLFFVLFKMCSAWIHFVVQIIYLLIILLISNLIWVVQFGAYLFLHFYVRIFKFFYEVILLFA